MTLPVLSMVTVQPGGAWAVSVVRVGEARVDVGLECHRRVLVGRECRREWPTTETLAALPLSVTASVPPPSAATVMLPV